LPAKRFFDAIIDLPFALPTAVAGIVLASLYAPNGFIGQYLTSLGLKVAFTPAGIVIALIFIGLPFIVRTIEPVLQEMDASVEEAALLIGATRWQIFQRIIFPNVFPAALTGFAMAFARGVGEYGSVIFIAGNLPYVSEIVPLLIITKLEQYDYVGATALALTMLLVSFLLLLLINLIQMLIRRSSLVKDTLTPVVAVDNNGSL
jgi:sulfate transport system permease protein